MRLAVNVMGELMLTQLSPLAIGILEDLALRHDPVGRDRDVYFRSSHAVLAFALQ